MLPLLLACSFKPPAPLSLAARATGPVLSPTCAPGEGESVEIARLERRIEVDMPLHGLSGLPIVRVEVGGLPVDMIVDTGAGVTILSSRIAERIGLLTEASGEAGSATGAVAYRLGSVDLALGGARFEDQQVAVIERDDLITRIAGLKVLEIEGILGWPVLASGRLTLDYAGQRLILEPSPGPLEGHELAWSGAPLIAGAVNGAPARLILDTGATMTMLHHTLEAPASLQLGELRTIGGGLGDERLRIRPSRAPVELWALGQTVRFDRLDVSLDRTGPEESCDEGSIGSDLLRDRVLVVDWPARKASLSGLLAPAR